MSHTRHDRRAHKSDHCVRGAKCLAEDRGIVPEGSSLLFGEVEISDTVDFFGPIQAEAGCKLHMGAVFGAGVVLGADVIVGSDSIVWDDSTIGDGSTIGEFCTIEDGVTIGKNVKLGDGVHIKQGAHVDDNAVIGTKEGGTVIGENSRVSANSDIQGTLNFVDENGELQELDLVDADKTVLSFWSVFVVNGKKYSFDLTPEPTDDDPELS